MHHPPGERELPAQSRQIVRFAVLLVEYLQRDGVLTATVGPVHARVPAAAQRRVHDIALILVPRRQHIPSLGFTS
jgi:hypothetical protein